MNEEDLKKIKEAQEETLSLVRQLARYQKWQWFFTITKWILVMVLLVASYFAIQPLLTGLTELIGANPALKGLSEPILIQQLIP